VPGQDRKPERLGCGYAKNGLGREPVAIVSNQVEIGGLSKHMIGVPD
jgi:hypothetical protein